MGQNVQQMKRDQEEQNLKVRDIKLQLHQK